MTYDANGNQLRGYNLMRNRARAMTWPAANRLRSATESAITLAFRYDADRNLVKKDVLNAGNSAWYVWYVDKLYEKRLSGTTATHIHYLEAGGEIVAAPVCSWRRMFSGRRAV